MVANIAHALRGGRPRRRPPTSSSEPGRLHGHSSTPSTPTIAAQIATLTNKKLVTNHDAFGYYVDRYGLDFVGSVIPSFDSQAELSPQDINDLVAAIKAQGVKAVFSESAPAAQDGRGHRQARPG